MTQEQKAKAYDEAIDKIADVVEAGTIEQGLAEWLFPELKESEDEKIKEDLIQWINEFPDMIWRGHYKKDVITWIEKQGEQGPSDNPEPKFCEGDWITNSIETVQITGYDIDYGYQVDYKGNLLHRDTDIIEKEYHIWTIQDAKDGDVLVTGNTPFLYSKHEKDKYGIVCFSYGGISSNRDEFIINTNPGNRWCDAKFVKPATKEQRELLFSKMKDAGYTFDFEKKDLSKCVIDEGKAEMDYCFTKMMKGEKVSSTWSEEDNQYFNFLEKLLENLQVKSTENKIKKGIVGRGNCYCGAVQWLKSIKNRIQPKPKQ